MVRHSSLLLGLMCAWAIAGCGTSQDAPPEGNAAGSGVSTTGGTEQSSPDETSPAAGAATALLQQAKTQLEQGKIAAAFQTLEKCLQVNNQLAEAWFLRAGILADNGQDKEALRSFNRCVTLEPNRPQYRNARGFFQLSRNELDAAIADFTEAVKIDPKYPQPYNNRGLALLAKQEFQQAIADFTEAVTLDPKYVDAFNNRGFAYLKTDRLDEALQDFNRAIELNPRYVNAFNNRAMLHAQRGELDKTVADLTAAIELDRHNPTFYRYRMQAYRKLGRDDLAQQDAERVTWLDQLERINRQVARRPNDPETLLLRAEHLARGGEKEIALASFESAARAAPNHVGVYLRRAEFWLREKEFAKAIADCDRAIAIEPVTSAFSIRGDAYFQQGNFDKAIADFERARRIDVTVAEAFWQRSLQHRKAGRIEQADADRARAIQLEPSFAQRQ